MLNNSGSLIPNWFVIWARSCITVGVGRFSLWLEISNKDIYIKLLSSLFHIYQTVQLIFHKCSVSLSVFRICYVALIVFKNLLCLLCLVRTWRRRITRWIMRTRKRREAETLESLTLPPTCRWKNARVTAFNSYKTKNVNKIPIKAQTLK